MQNQATPQFGDRVYVEDDGRDRPAYGHGTIVGFDGPLAMVKFDGGAAGSFALDALTLGGLT